jgi:hypothetical protein
VIAMPPIHFDRASGSLEGADLPCMTLAARNITIKFDADAIFGFPFGDGARTALNADAARRMQ